VCRLEIKCKRCGEIRTIVCGNNYAVSAGLGLGILKDSENNGVIIKKG